MRESLSQFVLGFCIAFAPAPLVGFGAWTLTRPAVAEAPQSPPAPLPQPGFAAPDLWRDGVSPVVVDPAAIEPPMAEPGVEQPQLEAGLEGVGEGSEPGSRRAGGARRGEGEPYNGPVDEHEEQRRPKRPPDRPEI